MDIAGDLIPYTDIHICACAIILPDSTSSTIKLVGVLHMSSCRLYKAEHHHCNDFHTME